MRGVLVSLIVLMGGVALADDAVSPAFTFDARYQPGGVTPDAWVAYEAEGLSSRFSAATVARAADENGNGIPDSWEATYGLIGANAAADADPDGDGRTNLEEYNAGTNPIVVEDYLASTAESARHVVDTWIESTAGGVWDLVEVWGISSLFLADTAGRAPDTDKDGLPDWWERLYGLNPTVADAHLDSDGDGRTNLEEYNAGTNPIVADDRKRGIAESGESFVTDTRVIYTGGNPTFDETFAVVRVSNGFVCDTGGLYYDWDGDGIPNWWEARFSRSGSKTGLAAEADDDGDGFSNYGEFVAYTNPTNAMSKFIVGLTHISVEPVRTKTGAGQRLSKAGSGAAGYQLVWQSAAGRTYSVYCTSDLKSGFGDTPLAEIEGSGEEIKYSPPVSGDALFFKVKVRLAK